jgi:hypothetical protein
LAVCREAWIKVLERLDAAMARAAEAVSIWQDLVPGVAELAVRRHRKLTRSRSLLRTA